MTFRSEKALDDVDWRLLDLLQADGRLSFKELGRRINLSAPAVAERVRRLEETGVITGYRAQVDARRAGRPLQAFVEMRCALSSCLLRSSVVLSTQFEGRPVQPPSDDFLRATTSEGWS
ncbi:Lrp/AsnC family transcriptional regulator [Amycolatopsis mediterranei]|uniref:Lrp/AsnC family transcriptional regulator n=1 Tax=Amycolatopsis mediterranei TaxID=33910 RepID=UPI0034361464